MNHLFYIMGKSSSGKDTVYKRLLSELELKTLVLYTTRPMRENEQNGREYNFVSEEELRTMRDRGSVIEERHYATVHGEWIYFTARESIDLSCESIGIGTLESYVKLRDFLGKDTVVPLYIEVEDGIRLSRALERERLEHQPKYAEMCRRFLADSADFSEENLAAAGIEARFSNNGSLEECIAAVKDHILNTIGREAL